MKRKNILKAAGIGFIVVLAAWGANTLLWRWKVEHRNKTVEICIDSLETAVICNNENYSLTQFLSEARSNGVSSLALYEETQDSITSKPVFAYLPENTELINITQGGRFSSELLYLAKIVGVKPLFRPLNRSYESPDDVVQKLGAVLEQESSLLAFGEESLGYPDRKEWLMPLITKKNIYLPVPEFSRQLGLKELARLAPGQVIRAHTVDTAEAVRLPYQLLISRYLRAVKERSCRLLYVHMLPSRGVRGNMEMLRDISNRLSSNGFAPGKAAPPPFKPVNCTLLKIFLAIITAVIFPLLALWLGLRQALNYFCVFLLVTLISFSGALLVGSLVSSREFMLGLETVHGIKMTMVVPIIGTVFLVFSKDTLRRFLAKPMTNIEFLSLCAVLAFLAALLIRSGNYNLFTPKFEIYLRDFLDRFLGVRPRFKEFLIGHPALLTGLYIYTKQKKGGFGRRPDIIWRIAVIIGAIGQISIINTFLHSHAPLSISFLRTFHGLWIGIILGALSIKTLSALSFNTSNSRL